MKQYPTNNVSLNPTVTSILNTTSSPGAHFSGAFWYFQSSEQGSLIKCSQPQIQNTASAQHDCCLDTSLCLDISPCCLHRSSLRVDTASSYSPITSGMMSWRSAPTPDNDLTKWETTTDLPSQQKLFPSRMPSLPFTLLFYGCVHLSHVSRNVLHRDVHSCKDCCLFSAYAVPRVLGTYNMQYNI